MCKCYQILRVKSYKKNDINGIQSHMRREHKPNTNINVDMTLSVNNITLYSCGQSYNDFVKYKTSHLKQNQKNKNANVLAEFIVTASPSWFYANDKDMIRKYFDYSLSFIMQKYGADNICEAIIHYDEVNPKSGIATPHLHIVFCPMLYGKLSFSKMFDNRHKINGIPPLRILQDEFYINVARHFSLQRGECGSSTKHLEPTIYKIKKDVDDLIKYADEARDINLHLENERNSLNEDITFLRQTHEFLEYFNYELSEQDKLAEQYIESSSPSMNKLSQSLGALKGKYEEIMNILQRNNIEFENLQVNTSINEYEILNVSAEQNDNMQSSDDRCIDEFDHDDVDGVRILR